MMNGTVFVKSYTLPPPDRNEVLRYAGCRESAEDITALLQSCLEELGNEAGRVCYTELPVSVTGDEVTIGSLRVQSQSLARHLAGAAHALVFAATVGLTFDRLIVRHGVTSPARALMFQALGAERIEALCDAFCAEHCESARRFSPGYGDLPLAFQKEIFRLLDCPRRIGLSLTESLLMSPSKSVTAIVGL